MSETLLMTPAEVAEYLRVHINTVYRWCDNGTLDAIRIGGSLRIRREDIEHLLERT